MYDFQYFYVLEQFFPISHSHNKLFLIDANIIQSQLGSYGLVDINF